MSNGDTRSVEIPMYQWKSSKTTTQYATDSTATSWAVNRKRVNDWMLDLLQKMPEELLKKHRTRSTP